MLFNSLEFIFLFLPTTLLVYLLLNRRRLAVAANVWLLLASLFFYGWWNPAYVPLIVGSILFNFTVGTLLAGGERPPGAFFSRQSILVCGIVGNIALLGYFKYADFFLGSLNAVIGTDFRLLQIVLPLGISFFTITQIAFLIDAYEGLVEERKLLNYALFVTFFPHLLAGPILHHKEMMPQFDRVRNKVVNYKNLALGLLLFFVGLFKKVAVADIFSVWANAGFDGSSSLHLVEAWVASLSYTFQLYFDFSGYSDMAIGLGLMFNIRLPVNFNSPYRASSVIDFWKRWHITLTTFITTYVYTPILRSFRRVTFARSLVAVFLAMFISGVWHGAGWTFVVWGTLHGAALVLNHLWRRRKWKMPAPLAWLLTFNFVNASFVFFRAESLADAVKVLKGMLGFSGVVLPRALAAIPAPASLGLTFDRNWLSGVRAEDSALLLLAAALTVVVAARNSVQMADAFRPHWRSCLFLVVVACYALVNMSRVSEFLYFQF